MTKVIITGAKGRMGKALLACAASHPEIEVVGEIDKDGNITNCILSADVVVDFSSRTATSFLSEVCAHNRKAMVIGTTGHSQEEANQILRHQNNIPIVWASNFSVGVNTLFWLTRKAAELLGPDFDLEVVEMHHRLKQDAPSGTAKTLAKILKEARALLIGHEYHERFGRSGNVGARVFNEIGIHSIRGGDVVGDHTVIFATNGERVELTHKASSREIFANGALLAAAWVVKQPPGLYSMQDVLGLA